MNVFLKKATICVLAVATVVGAGWFGRKAYKKATERRLLTEAQQYLEKKDIGNASLCLRRLLQINPLNVRGNSLIADMLEENGASAAALSWRSQAVRLNSNDVQLQLALAETALKAGDYRSAESALAHLPERSKSTAAYEKLSGALAWSARNIAEAEIHYTAASRLEPTNMIVKVNLATVRLNSTNRITADSGRQTLNEMTTNAELKLVILEHLTKDAENRRDLAGALEYSKRIIDDPRCSFQDKLAHAQLLRAANSQELSNWEASLKHDALQAPESMLLLGQWLERTEGPDSTLSWLRGLPHTVQTNQPVPLLKADCFLATKDWNELLKMVGTDDWADANYYRLMLESLAQRSLGQNLEAVTAWKRALKLSAHRVDHLSRMAQITADWGWSHERVEVLQGIIAEFPQQQRWAVDQLSAQFYAEGKTKELDELLRKAYETNPDNNRIKNNLANIMLLENTDVSKASQLAKDAYQSSREDPFFISTYAYSLLLQNKTREASEVISGIKQEYLKIPSIAAYYGVVEARSGHKNLAKEPLSLADAAHLLPEEKIMVRAAESQL
jgi:predicted Zn-dependent protease